MLALQIIIVVSSHLISVLFGVVEYLLNISQIFMKS